MPASKFREKLPIIQGEPEERLGVCAMGPVNKGAKLTWMRVWVWQQDGERVAASSGTSGEHVGGHAPAPTEQPPYTSEKGWMVQTKLEPGAEPFAHDKPALAMAMALVEHSDGTLEVEQWSQAVSVAAPKRH